MSGFSMLQWALRYAEAGFQVFPLQVRGKAPLIATKDGGNGFKDATTDQEQVRKWWTATPDANIGIRPTENQFVLDLDSAECLGSLKAAGYDIPATAWSTTSRGAHYWFLAQEGRSLRKCKPWPDVDLIQSDGYVLAPPSIHPTGVEYAWEVKPQEQNIAEAPDWVYKLEEAYFAKKAIEGPGASVSEPGGQRSAALEVFSGAAAGNRDNALYQYACRLRSLNVARPEAETLMRAAWEKIEQPAGDFMPWEHALGRLASAWKHPAGRSPQFERPAAERKTAPAPTSAEPSDESEFLTIEELMAKDFPPVRWLVHGLISEGLTIISAAPKIGKSWLVLNLALAVARGGRFMGSYYTEQGKVLFLDLEQPPKKTQQRLVDLMSSEPGGVRFPSGITFAHRWPRLNEGGAEKLDSWLTENPTCAMVAIDVLAKVRAEASRGTNAYEDDYNRYAELKAVADRHGAAIVAIHHDTKARDEADPINKFSGSRGLVAVADALIFMDRKRGEQDGKLFATGREIGEIETPIFFDVRARTWTVSGPVDSRRPDAVPV